MARKKKDENEEATADSPETSEGAVEETSVEAAPAEDAVEAQAADQPAETEVAAEAAADEAPAEEMSAAAEPAEVAVTEPAEEVAPVEASDDAAPVEAAAPAEEAPKKARKPAAPKAAKKPATPAETSDTKKASGKRAEKIGIISSDKMMKTVTVRVDRLVKHPIYRKYVKKRKKFMAHDDLGAKIGDKVKIVETRPLSARKRWRVVEILQRAES
jgi:small subunit ribosomal protein S17